MTVPAILIRLPLEGSPRVLIDAEHERDHQRLLDWLEAHEDYLELVREALLLEAERRAA